MTRNYMRVCELTHNVIVRLIHIDIKWYRYVHTFKRVNIAGISTEAPTLLDIT